MLIYLLIKVFFILRIKQIIVKKKKLEDIFGIIYIIDITKFVKIYYYNKVDFLIKVLIKFYKVEID